MVLPTWMAMDLNFNRELACLVTLQKRENGYGVFLHEWKKEGGINDLELAGEIATLTRRYRPRVLAYDPNTAGYIAPRLAQAGIPTSPTPWNSANFQHHVRSGYECDAVAPTISPGTGDNAQPLG
jgi:hypothetical protein